MRKYRISYAKARNYSQKFMEQVIACPNEEAKRLLLGVSR